MSSPGGIEYGDYELSMFMREKRISEMMDAVIYPDNIGREGNCVDTPWASTIAEAVSAEFDETAVPDDIADLERAEGGIDLMLRERHIADITTYAKTGTIARGTSLSNLGITNVAGYGFDESFTDTMAFGKHWYRRYTFSLSAGKLVMPQPMIQPWVMGGAPFPRAYTSKDADLKEAASVVAQLCLL